MMVENTGNACLRFPITGDWLHLNPGMNTVEARQWTRACESFRGRAGGPEALVERGVLVVVEDDESTPAVKPRGYVGLTMPNATPDEVNFRVSALSWGVELTAD